MAVPTIEVIAPQDGDTVPFTFTAHGNVDPDECPISAWATDADGNRSNGTPTSVEGSEWAFSFDVLRPGPAIVTVEAADESVSPPDIARVSRHVTVSAPGPGSDAG